MQPYWTNGVASLFHANALKIPLPDESVHCVVTSPPYWGLRDYGLGQWEGGDAECQHKQRRNDSTPRGDGGTPANNNHAAEGWKGGICGHCGARQQAAGIGLEPTLGEWVANIVAVGREVWRVLRDDGTFWLNLGDAYAGSWGNYGSREGKQRSRISEQWHRPAYENAENGYRDKPPGAEMPDLPAKNLMGQPWRVAFALQDDGWILRSAIVWHKPNPMPESATDRPTTAYEIVFLLSKQSKYFYDAEAVREPYAPNSLSRYKYQMQGIEIQNRQPGRERERVNQDIAPHSIGANTRNVWTIPTQGRRDAHFATFPDELPRRCILAGTSERGVCGECGAPWKRKGASNNPDLVAQALTSYMRAKGLTRSDLAKQVGVYPGNFWNWEHGGTPTAEMWNKVSAALDIGLSWEDFAEQAQYVNESKNSDPVSDSSVKRFPTRSLKQTQTVGWQPTCGCDAAVVPATVLDPFVGSGTTVAVAQALGRRGVGMDLNPEYLEIARKRIEAVSFPMLMEVGNAD